MSSEKQDWLSAASDNQGISATELDNLLRDPALQDQWLRYQMIGNAMRNELPTQLDVNFADRFELLLADEPVHQLQPEVVAELVPATAAVQLPWWKTGSQSAMGENHVARCYCSQCRHCGGGWGATKPTKG